MFAQIIRGKVSDPSAVRSVLDRWMADLGPTATGWLGSTSGVADDGRAFVLARFESESAARANSDRPEQGEWWAEMEPLFDGEPTFQDSNEVWVDAPGNPDAAGFVQVMAGQSSDPERSREIGARNMPRQRELRPEILGGVVVGHDDDRYTMVVYFESEEAAREGERKPIPADLEQDMEEMMALAVGDTEFLDLRSPWLDSPR